MTEKEIDSLIENYGLQASKPQVVGEKRAYLYGRFADFIETNRDILEDVAKEEDVWNMYYEQADEGFDMLNPNDEYE